MNCEKNCDIAFRLQGWLQKRKAGDVFSIKDI